MYGCIAKLTAKPGCKEELLEFLKWDIDVSRRQEPVTFRLDFWQDPDDDNSLILYEAYVNEGANEVHQNGEPFKKFDTEVAAKLLDSVTFIVPFTESLISLADFP
jgi:quinol monooxygenase YgiN